MGLRAFRRSAVVATLALGAVAVATVATPAGADEEFILGSGQVDARLVRVGPTAGSLSFAPSVGLALANYTNTVGRAESRYFDFAALDGNQPEQIDENTPAVRVDSTDEGAEKGKSRTTAGFPDGLPVRAGGSTQAARAGAGPFGEASFTLGDFAPVPGQVELSGGKAVTRAGVVDGARREAVATISYGRIALGGDAVVLQGVTWNLAQRTGKKDEATGSFGIEGIQAGGQKLQPPNGQVSPEQWKQLNDALKPLGIRLVAPEVTVTRGVAEISPLGIKVSANQASRAVGPPLLEAVEPVRGPIASGIIEAEPEAGGLFTIGDLTLGALAGTGSIDLQLGGATAYTEGEAFDDPFGSFDLGGPAGAVGPVDLGPSLGSGSDLTGGPATGGDEGSAGDTDDAQLAGSRRLKGTTGGAAAVVGLLGLLAVAGTAGADWWRLRHEPRRIAL